MDPRNLPPGFSLETEIRRDANRRWFHQGELVTHEGLARAFDAWIDRAEDGRYILKNDVNWGYVELEGPPLFVERARVEEQSVWLELSDGRTERMVPETLRQDESGALYCDARDGRLPARLTRHAMFALEPLVDEDDRGPYLNLEGKKVRPPVTATPLSSVRAPAPGELPPPPRS